MRKLLFLLFLYSFNLAAEELPPIVVYKDPDCGCCTGWISHMRKAGFKVEAKDVTDLDAVKAAHKVPADLESCHTAIVGGYVVEGHIPPAQVKKLLAEKPKIIGISLPGMPQGSPGMPGVKNEKWVIKSFGPDGVFAVE